MPKIITTLGLCDVLRFAVGERRAGTPYSHHIDAKFSDNSGTGHRVKGRTCTVSFNRKGP